MTEKQYYEAIVKIEFYSENGYIYHKLNEILLKNGIKLKSLQVQKDGFYD